MKDIGPVRRWFMLFVSMTAAITTTAVVNCSAFLIPQLHAEGLGFGGAGLFAAAAPLGLLLTTIPWGAAIDRYGERRILLLSLGGATVALIGTVVAFAAHAPLTVAALGLFCSAALAASCNGASGRIVVGWFPANSRGTAMGIRQMSQPLGIAVLSLLMPVLAHERSLAAAMTVPLGICVISLILVAVFITDPPRPERASAPAEQIENPYARSRFLHRVHAVSLLLVLPQGAVWTYGITWLIVGLHWTPTSAGLVVSASQILGALSRVAAGYLSDRVGSRTGPIKWIALLSTVSMIGLAVTTHLGSIAAIPVFLLASMVTVADNGLAFTAIAEEAGPFYSGRALAIQNTGQYLMITAAGPALGVLIGATGFVPAFALMALTPLIAYPLVPADRRAVPAAAEQAV
jgi:MFS family permease